MRFADFLENRFRADIGLRRKRGWAEAVWYRMKRIGLEVIERPELEKLAHLLVQVGMVAQANKLRVVAKVARHTRVISADGRAGTVLLFSNSIQGFESERMASSILSVGSPTEFQKRFIRSLVAGKYPIWSEAMRFVEIRFSRDGDVTILVSPQSSSTKDVEFAFEARPGENESTPAHLSWGFLSIRQNRNNL